MGIRDKISRGQIADMQNLQNSNLFNQNTVTADYYIKSTTGVLTSAAGFYASDYIEIDPAYNYCFDCIRHYAFYDSNKTYISGDDCSIRNRFEKQPPSNAKYLRFSFYPADGFSAATMQLVKGSNILSSVYNSGYKILGDKVVPPQIKINLPVIYGVIGTEIKIYYKNLLPFIDLSKYIIRATISDNYCTQMKDYLSFTPIASGTTTILIEIQDAVTGAQVAFARSGLSTKATTVGNGVTRKCLFIGDSTINAATATQRLLDLMDPDVMAVTLLGTRGTTPNFHEGRGGWTADAYANQDTYSSVANPFRSGGVFNFGAYMSAQGYSMTAGDHVIIQLGINDVFSYADDATLLAAIPNILACYETMINSIRAYNADIRIGIVCTIPPTDDADDFGTSYANTSNYHSLSRYKRNNYLFVKALMAKFGAQGTVKKIKLLPIHVGLDTASNITADVHPNEAGYNQIGDSYFAYIKSFES